MQATATMRTITSSTRRFCGGIRSVINKSVTQNRLTFISGRRLEEARSEAQANDSFYHLHNFPGGRSNWRPHVSLDRQLRLLVSIYKIRIQPYCLTPVMFSPICHPLFSVLLPSTSVLRYDNTLKYILSHSLHKQLPKQMLQYTHNSKKSSYA